MTSFKFTPEYFNYCKYDRDYAEAANDKLPEIKAAWLEELKKNAVRVYGRETETGWCMSAWNESEDTHSALLIGITELPKAKCEHHTITVHLGTESHGTWYECKKCDKRLKANWETI